MTAREPRTIELTEYQPACFPLDAVPHEVGEALFRTYGSKVAVDFPSPKTDGQWRFTAQGWVGYIPLTPELGIALRPKVELGNLFRMLEYAYGLKSFHVLEGLAKCRSLEEFYEQLANVLAKRVLGRGRKGFYRAYVPVNERLPYARGRLDVPAALRTPSKVKLPWDYEEHTPDIEDNRILAWTLFCIARSGICTERVLPTVRRAYRSLQGLVTIEPQHPLACVGRAYHRLNEDYQPLHALCRFLLEHTGPHHKTGDQAMLPFLVDTARLFELFVAEWMKTHLPPGFVLNTQERVYIGAGKALHFDIDVVLCDEATGWPRCVLDTKYKRVPAPHADDVAQAVAYAEAKGCSEALLVYPTRLDQPLDEMIGAVRVRSLTFSLDGDLERAGQAFLGSLLQGGSWRTS